jgi:hypothetical protein
MPKPTDHDTAVAERTRSAATATLADAAAHVGAERLASATDQVFHDAWDLFRVCEPKRNMNLSCRQGFAFEALETLKFNREAQRAGSPLQAVTTCHTDPRAAADIEIRNGAEVVRQIQCKSYDKPVSTMRALANPKYDGMGRLAPADQAEEIAATLELGLQRPPESIYTDDYLDVRENFMGELTHDDVASGGTKREQAEQAAQAPAATALRFAFDEAIREVTDATKKGAIGGAVFGGAAAGVTNVVAWKRGDASGAEAAKRTVKSTAGAAGKGAVVAGGGRVIAIAARGGGYARFSGGVGPAAMAGLVVDLTGTLTRYVNGNLTHEEFRDEATNILVGAAFSTFGGILGQAMIPVPFVGAVIGSLLGTALSGALVQAGAFGTTAGDRARPARVAELEAASAMVIDELERYQRHIADLTDAHAAAVDQLLTPTLDALDRAFAASDQRAATRALTALGAAFDRDVPFASPADFDAFVADESASLRI